MKKNNFKYSFIVFLYAYLIQVDLSLDRSRWTLWAELQGYYKDQLNPQKVVDYLLIESGLRQELLRYPCFIAQNAPFLRKIRYLLDKVFHSNSYLTNDEICFCCQKLLIFKQYLDSATEIHKLEIEKLRIELATFNFNVLQFKLYTKDRKRAQKVEHYLQNEILQTISIKEFIGGFSLTNETPV